MKYIEEYLQLVEKEKLHKVCKEQKQLAHMIRRIFESEADDIFIDEDRVEKYLSYQKYFDFVKRCREIGITVPIIPAIKPIVNRNQIAILPKVFHVDLPSDLAIELSKCKDDIQAKEVGVEWCKLQAKELIKAGVPSIHFYSHNATESVRQVASDIY